MKKAIVERAILFGLFATIILLVIYFGILTAVSGWNFSKEQFFLFWYYIVILALGFGVQVALYVYLKNAVHAQNLSKGMIVATGSTSTIAMISCCAHYLVNLLPVLGVTGLVTIVAQYQVELFWVGILANLLGIFYASRKIYQFSKQSKYES